MSHTLHANGGTTFHYNSDGSGDVTIVRRYGSDTIEVPMKVPMGDIFELVAEIVRDKQIEEIEQRGWKEILFSSALRTKQSFVDIREYLGSPLAFNPKNALAFLRKDEWSMGNGQCPDCLGLAPRQSWYRAPGGIRPPHPAAPTPGHEGHKHDCKRAEAIIELGGTVVSRTEGEQR